jgi:DNA-binding MarR family transcriptional regulator
MQETNMNLYKKFSRLGALLHRYQIFNLKTHGPMADPTRGQGRVLAILKLQPEISTKDLSYLLGIRQQSLAELLVKLEKNGYLTRTQSESDKRVMMIKLTEKGRNAEQKDMDWGDIFGCLNEEERNVFGAYLDRILAALVAQVGDEPGEDLYDWMLAARERHGERFEQLLAMRGGHPFGHGFGGGRDRGGFAPFYRGEHGDPCTPPSPPTCGEDSQ